MIKTLRFPALPAGGLTCVRNDNPLLFVIPSERSDLPCFVAGRQARNLQSYHLDFLPCRQAGSRTFEMTLLLLLSFRQSAATRNLVPKQTDFSRALDFSRTFEMTVGGCYEMTPCFKRFIASKGSAIEL